jgi:hypothetical protein
MYESSDHAAARALVGKLITGLLISTGEGQLCFETSTGDVIWDTEGDCCSETWFADINGVSALADATVLSCEVVELPDPNDDRSRQDSDSAYGMRVRTNKGSCDIVYRNSSNGYYGGSCYLGTQRDPSLRLIEEDDWRA